MIAQDLAGLATPLGKLRPLPGNPRRGDVPALIRSLEQFGQRKPIVARRSDGVVLAGNHMLAAAQQLAWPEVAVVWVDDDVSTGNAYAVADNRIADLGDYDVEALAALVAGVHGADGELLEAMGYTLEDYDRLLASVAGDFTPDDSGLAALDELTADQVTCPNCGHSWDRNAGT